MSDEKQRAMSGNWMAWSSPLLSGLIPRRFQHRHPGRAPFAPYPGSGPWRNL